MDFQLYDSQTTANFLNVSYSTLRGLMRSGKIGFHRIGKTSIRFSDSDIKEFLDKTSERAEADRG